MEERIAGLTVAEAAALVEANLAAHYAYLRALPGAELHDNEVLTWFRSPVSQPFFNVVLRAQPPSEVADATIGVMVRRYRERGLPLRWWVGPLTSSAGLGQLLGAHGGEHVMDSPGMAADLARLAEPAAPEGLVITRADTPDLLAHYCRAFTTAFGVPANDGQQRFDAFAPLGLGGESPLRHYVGLLHGEPVASATAFLGGDAAGLYHVGVVPGARRRGIGAAITLAPLRDAREAGYRVGVLQAIPPADRVYAAIGFRTCGMLGVYQWT